jgi:hypothetical protein
MPFIPEDLHTAFFKVSRKCSMDAAIAVGRQTALDIYQYLAACYMGPTGMH